MSNMVTTKSQLEQLKKLCKALAEGKDVSSSFTSFFDEMGLQHKRSQYLTFLLEEAWKVSTDTFDQKLWALSKGFLPDKLQLYKLSEENYGDYLSDYDYFLIHPLNNHFAIWINDKITLKYMLQAPLCINKEKKKMMDLMPEYYLYIENDGRYSYLMDAPESIKRDGDFIMNLVKDKGILALKPSNGLEVRALFVWNILTGCYTQIGSQFANGIGRK